MSESKNKKQKILSLHNYDELYKMRNCNNRSSLYQLIELAENGDYYAQGYVALIYHDNENLDFDFDEDDCKESKIDIYAANARHQKDSVTNVFLTSSFIYRGLAGYEREELKAIQFLEAISNQNSNASLKVGYHYFKNNDVVNASKWFEKSATLQNPDAFLYVGICNLVNENYVEALKNLQYAIDLGNGLAYYYVGKIYDNGYGVDVNTVIANEYYKKSSNYGDKMGMYNVALSYRENKGTRETAFNLFKKSADLGLDLAQVETGICYYNEIGVKADESEAVKYFKHASQQYNIEGSYRYGWCLFKGRGGVRNLKLGVECYKKASIGGHIVSTIETSFLSLINSYKESYGLKNEIKSILDEYYSILGKKYLAILVPCVEVREIFNPYSSLEDSDTDHQLSSLYNEDYVAPTTYEHVNGMYDIYSVNTETYELSDKIFESITVTRQFIIDTAPIFKLGYALMDPKKLPKYSNLEILFLVDQPTSRFNEFEYIHEGNSEDILKNAYSKILNLRN